LIEAFSAPSFVISYCGVREKLSVVSEKIEHSDSLLAQMYEEGLERLNRLCVSINPQDTESALDLPPYYPQLERVRGIFSGEIEHTTPVYHGISETHSDITDNNPNFQEIPDLNPNLTNIRVICDFCRLKYRYTRVQCNYFLHKILTINSAFWLI
jgi:hypothetical protein